MCSQLQQLLAGQACMFTGGDDAYGAAPAPRQKKEQANDANDDAMDAENQQASFRPAHNADLALHFIQTMCVDLDHVALLTHGAWSDQTHCGNGLHLQC